ncbi:MAG: hypothetical protein IPJ68_02320 [Candidatus Moraniibacteriota bacterium]|nr:MAG: hypothetical protein IPJ68_02320 [Candidatus Moranbacteria bacterium]
MAEEAAISIDPRIFISEPYITCPKCSTKNFGVLIMTGGNDNYTRRCTKCWYSQRFDLPVLEKHIIYLDQFAISNMMLALNAKLGKTEKVDKFWLKLFEKLERLHRLQLIEIPDSTFHRTESKLGKYAPLKKMYDHFSGGTTFLDAPTIRRFQVASKFRKLGGEKDTEITKDDVLENSHGSWGGRIYVTVDSKVDPKDVEAERNARERIADSLKATFERWQKEKGMAFPDWFKEEGLAWGKAMSQRYAQALVNYGQAIENGTSAFDPSTFFEFWDEQVLVHSLITFAPGKDRHEKFMAVVNFLSSEEMLDIPFNEIAASLWAAIAHQAAHGGRKLPPNRGMASDVEMISTLLPYVDAMLVDREMAGLLSFGDVQRKIAKYDTKILSLADKEDIFGYLDSIEAKMTPQHLKLVEEVYGKDWVKPYLEMYE